jgi:type IV pilus assembly protein PilW
MMKHEKGMGLIEVMIAMVLGLVVVLGITQIFTSSKQSFLTQDSSARLQEDARYLLSRMTQELRMAGMFGCVAPSAMTGYPAAFNTPIDWAAGSSTLTVITSAPVSGTEASSSDWTILTNCSTASVQTGTVTPGTGEVALPIRKVEYQYNSANRTVSVREGTSATFQPLVSGVSNFEITFGMASGVDQDYVSGNYSSNGSPVANIRSVRINLTLSDSNARSADQTYSVVAALRNRLP